MFWALAVFMVVSVIGSASMRLDQRGRRQAWLGSLVAMGIGGVLLVIAMLTWNFGLFYLSALVLGVGVPLSLFLTAALYLPRGDVDGGQFAPRGRNAPGRSSDRDV